jgi:hypothetical protein
VGVAGQSSFLAIIYYYFGINPLFAIPLNALFHSFSAILIYLIAIELLKGSRFSESAGLVSSLCYLTFPSELFLVGQIHKDLFVAFGFLLALWSILKMFLHQDNIVSLLKIFLISIVAVLVVAIMKPYLLQVLALTLLLIILLQLVRIFPFSIIKFSFLIAYLAITLSIFLCVINKDSHSIKNAAWLSGESFISPALGWKKSDVLPEFIDKKLMALGTARSSLISSGIEINAKSMIDVNEKPASATEVLIFIPRAFQIALLSPFPNSWFYEKSIVKLVSSVEMLIFYLAFLGLIFLAGKQYQYTFLICFVFALVPLMIFGISIPNIGTLYRYRYPFEMILLMLGICGYAHKLNRNSGNLFCLKKGVF